MIKCLFCNKPIEGRRLTNPLVKYCSNLCNKRAWYLRDNPNAKSHINNNPDFWKTETGKGFRWEIEGAKVLGATHLKFNGNGADLDWNGKKVDVKSCNLYIRKRKRGKELKNPSSWWVFNRNNVKPMDFFLCFCIKDDKPVKILLIPANEFPLTGATVGHISRFDKYDIL